MTKFKLKQRYVGGHVPLGTHYSDSVPTSLCPYSIIIIIIIKVHRA